MADKKTAQGGALAGREIIIEFHPIGTYMKVVAMDVKTLTEAATQGPASAGEKVLEYNALKRLEYVMKKKGLI
ncbi:MAG: hypothetical protein KJ667_08625 [Alphaproteobacteria bacterium]|nr:hypothetical protein [Alphaproteobacteria bacterium]